MYAANTVGAIAGILAAVHLLMPFAGVKGAIVRGAVIHMGLGVSGLLLAERCAPLLGVAMGTTCVARLQSRSSVRIWIRCA